MSAPSAATPSLRSRQCRRMKRPALVPKLGSDMSDSRFLTRLRLDNYKSIARCDVRPGQLSFLVGPNGAGKSNFLDSLRFLADSLNTSLEHALLARGGIDEVCHRSPQPAAELGIALELALPGGGEGSYAVVVGREPEGGFAVRREKCVVRSGAGAEAYYTTEAGELVGSSAAVAPAVTSDRLYLVHASGLPEFRLLYDALSSLGLYNISPAAIRELQPLDGASRLAHDGRNLAAVFRRLSEHSPALRERIEEYLRKVVPEIVRVEARRLDRNAVLEFREAATGAQPPRILSAANMSDGTLRALAILVALHQTVPRSVPLVGIEEPEIAFHPVAMGVLLDCLIEASHRTQVLITSHSPELLEDKRIGPDAVLPVVMREGTTRIGPPDQFARSALRDRITTVGELLRLNQLAPELAPSGSELGAE